MKRLLLGAVASAQDTTEIANEFARANAGCTRTIAASQFVTPSSEMIGYRVTPATKEALRIGCANLGEVTDRAKCTTAINKIAEASENYVSYESLRITRKTCKLQWM